MNKCVYLIAVAAISSATTGEALAEDKEPTAVIALGGAGEWGVPGATSLGASASVEFSVIRDWLEIEIGAAHLVHRGVRETEADVIFKKPFTLSPTVEFMAGAGPAVSYTRDEGAKLGATFALDFMFWPERERRFGWFVEPTYTISQGNEKSFALSIGLLVAIP